MEKKKQLKTSFNPADLKKYTRHYSDTKFLIGMLESATGETFASMWVKADRAEINVTPEQIQTHLTENLAAPEQSQEMKSADAALNYYATTVDILKQKSLTLLDLINKLSQRDFRPVQGLIKALDLHINKRGYLANGDFQRLIKPTAYNLQSLSSNLEQGNNLNTYLHFPYVYPAVVRNDAAIDEVYPYRKLQRPSIYNDCELGNVPLSAEQTRILTERERQNLQLMERMLSD